MKVHPKQHKTQTTTSTYTNKLVKESVKLVLAPAVLLATAVVLALAAVLATAVVLASAVVLTSTLVLASAVHTLGLISLYFYTLLVTFYGNGTNSFNDTTDKSQIHKDKHSPSSSIYPRTKPRKRNSFKRQ